MEYTSEHKKYLSHILAGTDEPDILDAAVRAANKWGISPQDSEPTDEEWSAAEAGTMEIADVIREGLGDGTITVSKPAKTPKVSDEDADDASRIKEYLSASAV